MSLSYLLQQLDALGPLESRTTLLLDQSFTGSTALITMFQSVLGQDSLTIHVVTDLISRSSDQLVLVGTASLLGMTDAAVTLTAKDIDGQLGVKIEIAVPNGWAFSQTFSELPEGEPLFDIGFVTGNEPHFLDQLGLGVSTLVVSTHAYRDDALGLDVVPGLNFSGEIYFLGALYGLGLLIGQDNPVRLSGPLTEYCPTADPLQFLGMRLSAPFLMPSTNLGPLSIQKSQVYVKSGRTPYEVDRMASATQAPGIYVLVDGALAGRPLAMVGQYDMGSGGDTVFVRGRFTDFAVSGFAGLSQSVGVDGFADKMPEGFPSPAGLHITEFGIGVNTTERSVTALLLGVGCQMQWAIIPDVMTLSEVSVSFLVTNPFNSTLRSFQTTFTGLLAFKKFNLAASATFPTYEFSAGLPVGQTLPLGDVIESFVPGSTDLPALTVTKLLVSAAPKTSKYSISASMENLLSIPVGKTSFDVSGFLLNIAYDKAAGGARGALTARMKMGDARAVISGDFNQAFTFSGSVQNFDLKKFWSLVTNGEAMPNEIPDIVFNTLSVQYAPKTGAFLIVGNTTIAWDHLSDTTSLTTNVQFSFSRGASSGQTTAIRASLTLQGQGPVHVVDGFRLETFNFLFEYQTSLGWKLSGGVGVDVFDNKLDLQAGYESAQGVQKIKLRLMAAQPTNLITLAGVGAYSFSLLELLLERRTADGNTKTFFDLRLASTLTLDNLFAVSGYLDIADTAEGQKALSFKPNPGTAAFRIDFPAGQGMAITAELFEIGFAKESSTSGWSFTGTTIVGFAGFPGFLGKALPTMVTTKLVAGTTTVRFSALNVTSPVEVSFPSVRGQSLGKAVVQLIEFGINIKPELGLVIEAGLGLPAELNAYLGGQIFRVYEPGNSLSMARTRLIIAGTGVALQFLSSPFAAANTVAINGESWFDVDFGQYGAIRLKMPTFVYDGAAQYFEVGGGIVIQRPLALPLAPLKMFLEACGSKNMADVFPSKIPMEGLMLVDSNGNLKVDEFVAFVKKAGDVPSDVTRALKETGQVLNRFPAGFKQYLNLEIPSHLEFKFGFSPTGRISIGLLAPEKPVRVLFPAMVQSYVPMPGLWGLEVRKFTVGTLMAGSLLYGEIDAIIDQFDLPSLIVSLTLPTDPSFPLPTSNELQRRVILDDVFCIIPVQAGVPVPIPLFYDEIGFEYLGVEGLRVGAHIGLPKPPFGVASSMAIFQAFESFTTNPKALLDPNTPPGGVNLSFHFHDEFVQVPEYLGGKVLGTQGQAVTVSTWKYLASLMNFGKTFSLNECIGAIPMENRVGSANHQFAFLQFDADWLLTTPKEFKNGAFGQLRLSANDVQDFLNVLPAVASTGGQQVQGNEQGLVTFVRGQADLGFMRFSSAFGLVASGSMGFHTGFKLAGTIGKMEMVLQGAVMVNAPSATTTPIAPAPQPSTPAPAPAPMIRRRQGGRALSLNGKNAWVEIPASDSLMLPEYTIELWIRSSADLATSTWEWVEVFGIDTITSGRNCYLEINTPNAYYFHRFKDSSGPTGAPNTPSGSVKWGQWQHVALTNSGGTAKTYINGQQVSSGSVQGPLVLFKSPIFMGKEPGAGLRKFWKGEIAEVRIWKVARRASQIAEFMREVLTGTERDLISLYRFDTDTGGKAVDLCGRNHGTITNGVFVESDQLYFEGMAFDGKCDYIDIPDSESLRLGPYTVEAWIKPYIPVETLANQVAAETEQAFTQVYQSMLNAAQDTVQAVQGGTSGTTQSTTTQTSCDWGGVVEKKGYNYSMFINRKGFVRHDFHTTMKYNDRIPDTANGIIAWNKWNHLAITNDGTTARTFVNGVKQAEGAVTTGGLIIDKEAVSIGRTRTLESEYFWGQISEVRIWSGARSEADIVANMTRRLDGKNPGLVSLWRMADAVGSMLPDLCGRNPGRLAKPLPIKPEPVVSTRQGLVFNGTSDYARFDPPANFKLSQFTVEVWVRPELGTQTSQCLWGAGAPWPTLFLRRNGQLELRYNYMLQGAVRDLVRMRTDPGVVQFGQWNHIALTCDRMNFCIMVNGDVKFYGNWNNLSAPPLVDGVPIHIGWNGIDGEYFAGELDELRIWAKVWTPQAITAAILDESLIAASGSLAAHYKLDRNDGSVLRDSGPNKAHGIIVGAKWAQPMPGPQATAAMQIQGHTHLKLLGREVLTGDLRLIDSTFWFQGTLDLFPSDWPLRVYGHVEGKVTKNQFYLSGETENNFCGLVLSKSRVFLSNDQMRFQGQWLGMFLILNVSWDQDNPLFAGSAGFRASPTLDFGTIRMNGVKVAENVRLKIDIETDVAVSISRSGFSASIHAEFKIGDKDFALDFGIRMAPENINDLVNWIAQRIIDAPLTYLAHLFTDAATWLKNVTNEVIKFAKNLGAIIGGALKNAFNVTQDAVSSLMRNAGYAANQVGDALGKAYDIGAQEAAKYLRSASYAVEDIGNALKLSFGKGAEESAKLLKNIGYGATEVNRCLTSAYKKTKEECEELLGAVGFSPTDINNALGTAGNAIGGGVQAGWNEVSSWF